MGARDSGWGEVGGDHIPLASIEPSLITSPKPLQADMQRWEEQSQGAIYTVEYACR